jgi:hypothetical protein
VGHDKSPEIAKKAQQKGAVDDVKFNLPAAVREANIVLLSLPVNEIRATLEVIAPDLPEGVVVMDTPRYRNPLLSGLGRSCRKDAILCRAGACHQPDCTCTASTWVEAAEEDLFDDGVVMLSTTAGHAGKSCKSLQQI